MRGRRFLTGYYFGNGALLLSYIFFRELVDNAQALRKTDLFGISREGQVIYCLVVVLILKWSSSPTWDAYIGTVFMWGKVGLLILAFLVGWRFAVYYFVGVLGIKLLWPQPEYDGPHNITYLEKDTFCDCIEDTTAFWLVEFYTTWSPPCVQIAPLFARLSMKYGSSTLKFGKVDVGKYPELAEEFRISTKGTSRQLPTLILFSSGREKARLPPITQNKVLKCSYLEKDIVSGLDLEYASRKGPSLRKTSGSRKNK